MPNYLNEPEYTHGTVLKTGVLVVNLGTPDAPEKGALRRYLGQFLSDPRVVEIPRLFWWPILHGIILNTRPARSAKKYASIWSPEGSPLRVHTERQAAGLAERLAARVASPTAVTYAMRYGQPSIAAGIAELKARHCDRILLLPLYPQYAASTTASSMDALFDALRSYRNVPGVRVVRHYHDHPAYIEALRQRVESYWAVHGRPDKLVMSFHGVPRYTLDRGDPYHCECLKTGRLLGEALGLQPEQYAVSFQSLFGRAEWIKPYTEPLVRQFGRDGVGNLHVVCPGFPADCLETLEEIGMEVKTAFLTEGGREYHYIPALNEEPAWLDALTEIALEHLGGWGSPHWSETAARSDSDLSLKRALAAGASR
ncbi:MAG: ferrochelatase [Betaproteobacteria bacterium]|nr:ferrochelatase [Betaproteobacteria bacterium]